MLYHVLVVIVIKKGWSHLALASPCCLCPPRRVDGAVSGRPRVAADESARVDSTCTTRSTPFNGNALTSQDDGILAATRPRSSPYRYQKGVFVARGDQGGFGGSSATKLSIAWRITVERGVRLWRRIDDYGRLRHGLAFAFDLFSRSFGGGRSAGCVRERGRLRRPNFGFPYNSSTSMVPKPLLALTLWWWS